MEDPPERTAIVFPACGCAGLDYRLAGIGRGGSNPTCPPLDSREYSNLRGPLVELCGSYGVFEHGGLG